MADKVKKFKIRIPLVLLLFNSIFISFLVEELLDATEPNYGFLGFLTPLMALISLLYIRKFGRQNASLLKKMLQGLNWFFIIFPIIVIAYIMLSFV
ncbi:hypothetical protein [Salipaludibacillus aurantiacus]|uniref:Uncharacterized protein n=1 Tax=Salipaludibacillus aurantiacus TaxID=1601833 RepID=A0A1H9W567_9BACI|nr:hypothetical protein [Salipaludibacillus aurantiacus]SES28817.1 hypothetical protein SAMN05518684_11468 [Salipaludibacillus aurantiacus]